MRIKQEDGTDEKPRIKRERLEVQEVPKKKVKVEIE
jgi:hypothetical protein